jgi:hypothetical protein
MKLIQLKDSTFKKFIKCKGEVMALCGENPTHDDMINYLMEKKKKEGGNNGKY